MPPRSRVSVALALLALGCAGTSHSSRLQGPVGASGAESTSTPAEGGPLGDPVALWPNVYRVLFENEYVRLLDIRMKPGERDDWHAHPANAGYVLAAAKLRVHAPDGSATDVEAKPGMGGAHARIAQHWMENIGTTDVHILFAERKGEPPRLAGAYVHAPSADPEVYRVVAESDWFRVIEIRGAPGVEGAVHSHQASVVYAIDEARVSHTVPGEPAVEQTLAAGKAVYVPAVAKHTMRNLGAAATRIVMFELK